MDLIVLLIILLLHKFDSLPLSAAECEAITDNGGLLGTTMLSRSGRQFCAFLGVPYATAPIGKLRFLPPGSPQPWEGLKNFTKESFECVQTVGRGSEDCLYLNVFTHRTKEDIRKTVMVYIHGGGYRLGSSSTSFLGPHYLLDKDIVLVTLQYRLGPFGFLSTEDNVIAGNMGMKDQVKALQWVQKNIRCFGGDAGKVTLFGNSAGGASVHLLMLSPISKDLFARGISQSGTALSGFALAPRGANRNITLDIVSQLNCSLYDSHKIISCLQNKTSDQIITSHYNIIKARYNRIILRPNVEVESEHAFLTAFPHEYTTNKPWMVGVVANEGITMLPNIRLNAILKQVNNSFSTVGPEIIFLKDKWYNNVHQVNNRIYNFYFRNSTNDPIKSLEELITDSWFAWPTENAIANYNHTFYYYLYDHLGEHSNVEYYDCPRGFGVAHTDELIALFSNKIYPPLNQQDTIISKLMVDFWVNFAVEGNPTPRPINTNPEMSENGSFIWEETNNVDRKYLHIGTKVLEMKQRLFYDRMELWRELELDTR